MSDMEPRIEEMLGEIKASLAHLEAEVSKLRDWRHSMADRFGALAHVPELLLAVQSEVRGVRDQVAALQREHAKQEGARLAAEQARSEYERERDRLSAWVRWGVPALWAAGASLVTWLTAHKIGGNH